MSFLSRSFLWGMLIWLAPFLRWQMGNEAKFKKNICIGTTLPAEAKEDEEVLSLIDKYKRSETLVCIVLLVTCIAGCVFCKDIKWMINSYCLWCDLCVILPYIPFARTCKKLREIKKERGWNKESACSAIHVDMSAIPEQKWISPWIFLILTAVCFLPMLWSPEAWPLYCSFAASNLIAWLCYRFCFRTSADIVDDNMELTIALTKTRRYYWSKLWIITAVSMTLMSLASSLIAYSTNVFIIAFIVLTIVIIVEALKVEIKVRKLMTELTKDSGHGDYIDEDQYWLCGILYCNPNDNHSFVNLRSEMGTTVNIAKPAGKFMAIFLVILLVLMPFTGNLVENIGSKEITATIENEKVIVNYGEKPYQSVRLEEIESIKIIENLPDDLSRIAGTATDNLYKGSWKSEELNKNGLTLCLDPKVGPYIMLEKKSGNILLFGMRSSDETLEVYKMIEEIK